MFTDEIFTTKLLTNNLSFRKIMSLLNQEILKDVSSLTPLNKYILFNLLGIFYFSKSIQQKVLTKGPNFPVNYRAIGGCI